MIMGAAVILSGCSNIPGGNATETETKSEVQEATEDTEAEAKNSVDKAEDQAAPEEESNEVDAELSEDLVRDSDIESEETG